MGTISQTARQVGAALEHTWPWFASGRTPRRAGFGNAQLIAALGVVLLIGLLMMWQEGDITLPSSSTKATASAKASTDKSAAGGAAKPANGKGAPGAGTSTTPLPLFVMASGPPEADPAAQTYLDRRFVAGRADDWRVGRTQDAFSYMDEAAAAQIVAKLDDQHAYDLLSGMDYRGLGRILSAAPPDKAAAWTRLLLASGTLPVVPPALRSGAADHGMYENLDALLKAAGYAPDGTPLKGGKPGNGAGGGTTANSSAAGSATVPGGTPPGSLPPGNASGTTPAGTTPAGGGAATPAGGAAAPAGGATPPSTPGNTPPPPGAPGTAGNGGTVPGTPGSAGSAAPGGAGGQPPAAGGNP